MARRRLLPIGITLAVLAGAAYGILGLARRAPPGIHRGRVRRGRGRDGQRTRPRAGGASALRDNEDVRAGQLLVEIDPRDFQIRVEQARATVAMATAEARGARSEVPLARDSTKSRLQQARATVAAARVAVDVGRAEADLQDAYLAAGADADTARRQALQHLYEEVQRQAAMNAFADDFLRLAALFAVTVPLVWAMRRPADAPRPQPVEAV